MPHFTKLAAAALISSLAACGGGGSDDNSGGGGGAATFNANLATATTANGGDLETTELSDQSNADPTDDEINTVGGFAVASGGSFDTAITSRTVSPTMNPSTEVTLNGTTYVITGVDNTSDDGRFTFLTDSVLSGESTSVSLLGTGTDLDGMGTPDEIYGYVRGLAAVPSDITVTGAVTYTGDTRYAVVGSDAVEEGTFSLNANFGNAGISGTVTSTSVMATIDGNRDGSTIQGAINLNSSSDSMALSGNLYGLDAEEFAGAAQGTVGGNAGVMVLSGTR